MSMTNSPGPQLGKMRTTQCKHWAVPLEKRKKRGRKEVLRRERIAAHGFRNLSVIKIPWGFEREMTLLKTKYDYFVNIMPWGIPRSP